MREANLEKVLMELSDIAASGNSAQGAYSRFKESIYDLFTASEKRKVKEILLSILQSDKYDLRLRAYTAYICASLNVKNSKDETLKLMPLAPKNSIDEYLIKDSLEVFKPSYLLKKAISWMFMWMPKVRTWHIKRILKDIEQEKDPIKKLEKQVILEISGILQGGMATSTAFMGFKKYFYDKISGNEEKNRVKEVLITILKSNEYRLRKKTLVAWVCADVGAVAALDEIKKIIPLVKNVRDKADLEMAVRALETGKTMIEVIRQKAIDRGDL